MTHKTSRAGGKYSGNHTTLTHAAKLICRYAEKSPMITRISPAYIKAGLRSASGNRRVKIHIASPSAIKLSVRDNVSHQEVYLFVRDPQSMTDAIAMIEKGAKEENIAVRINTSA